MEDLSCWHHGPIDSLTSLSLKSKSDQPVNSTIWWSSDTALPANLYLPKQLCLVLNQAVKFTDLSLGELLAYVVEKRLKCWRSEACYER